MKEIWKDIKGYEGIYEVSSLGRIKSNYKDIPVMLVGHYNRGYKSIGLYLNGHQKTRSVHQLVAIAFLNHIPCGMDLVVDHIDMDKSNNSVKNLQLITNRENISRSYKNKSSKHTGICWYKNYNKWMAHIRINGVKKTLGYFEKEIDAHKKYQEALKIYLNNSN